MLQARATLRERLLVRSRRDLVENLANVGNGGKTLRVGRPHSVGLVDAREEGITLTPFANPLVATDRRVPRSAPVPRGSLRGSSTAGTGESFNNRYRIGNDVLAVVDD